MEYVSCESAKEMVRMRLFVKKSYLKKLQFSIIIISFKIGLIGIVK